MIGLWVCKQIYMDLFSGSMNKKYKGQWQYLQKTVKNIEECGALCCFFTYQGIILTKSVVSILFWWTLQMPHTQQTAHLCIQKLRIPYTTIQSKETYTMVQAGTRLCLSSLHQHNTVTYWHVTMAQKQTRPYYQLLARAQGLCVCMRVEKRSTVRAQDKAELTVADMPSQVSLLCLTHTQSSPLCLRRWEAANWQRVKDTHTCTQYTHLQDKETYRKRQMGVWLCKVSFLGNSQLSKLFFFHDH